MIMAKKGRIEPVVHIVGHDDGNADLRYWLTRSPEERINAVLQLREQHMRVMGHFPKSVCIIPADKPSSKTIR